MSSWAGRKVRRLVNAVLHLKGTTCHLCGLPGADSADHDPPRSVLVERGEPNPDAIRFLFPSHRYPCNLARKARPITPALILELRRKRLELVGPLVDPATRSPRFLRPAPHAGRNSFPLSPGSPQKTEDSR